MTEQWALTPGAAVSHRAPSLRLGFDPADPEEDIIDAEIVEENEVARPNPIAAQVTRTEFVAAAATLMRCSREGHVMIEDQLLVRVDDPQALYEGLKDAASHAQRGWTVEHNDMRRMTAFSWFGARAYY